MRIKKFRNNQYALAEGIWTRNPFCEAKPVDINGLSKKDVPLFLRNESENQRIPHMQFEDAVGVGMDNVAIVSDGFLWEERQKVLGDIPNGRLKVIGVNGSLAKWTMVGEGAPIKRTMTFYVVNNPYQECMGFLPKRHRYYPNIVASTRTNPKFLAEYKNQPYLYRPTPDTEYSGPGEAAATLDDYRNPVCAAISLAIRGGVRRLLLLCCDEAFQEERPGAVRMKNGLFQYPAQIVCQRVIDRHLFWAKGAGVKVGDCSSGIEYENAEYISPEGILDFFDKEDDG